MSILDTIRKQLNQKPSKATNFNFKGINSAPNEVPTVIEKTNQEWVGYGDENNYLIQLNELKYGSAIHNSILKTKVKMMAGDGLLYNGAKTQEESDAIYQALPVNVKAEVDYLNKNKVGGVPLDEMRTLLSSGFEDYGAYCYSLIFNKDFTKISGIKFYKLQDIRAGKKDKDGKIKYYYYSSNWEKCRQVEYKPVQILAYYEGSKDGYEQMVYRKTGNLDYYGIPSYSGAINWIYTDFQMSVFHKANMENGMNPGLHFKFYKTFANEEEEEYVRNAIKKQWQGASKTGKMIMTASDGKDLAMDIQPIQTSDLDKQLMLVAELCDQKILSGHQLTTPALAGISPKGFSSGGTELEVGYQIFDGLTMASDRAVLEKDFNLWYEYNKTGVKVEIDKFKPFGADTGGNDTTDSLNSLSPLVATKVLETMTQNEIRALAGLPPVTEPIVPVTTPTNNIVTNG